MQCPKCGRRTSPRVRTQSKEQRERSGALQAATSEGYCFRDYMPTVGPQRDGVRQRIRVTEYHEPFDVEHATRTLMNFLQGRNRRGVPRDGLAPETLAKPGLFLMEVP